METAFGLLIAAIWVHFGATPEKLVVAAAGWATGGAIMWAMKHCDAGRGRAGTYR